MRSFISLKEQESKVALRCLGAPADWLTSDLTAIAGWFLINGFENDAGLWWTAQPGACPHLPCPPVRNKGMLASSSKPSTLDKT